jgi:hypothetical protein
MKNRNRLVSYGRPGGGYYPCDLGKVQLDTRAEDLLTVLADGPVSGNVFMRRLHDFCIGINWLPWPILAKKLWPLVKFKNKRAIKPEEHAKTIAREQNVERRNFYKLYWHLRGLQFDIAELGAEDIEWTGWTVCYIRKKLETRPVAGVPQVCLNL